MLKIPDGPVLAKGPATLPQSQKSFYQTQLDEHKKWENGITRKDNMAIVVP